MLRLLLLALPMAMAQDCRNNRAGIDYTGSIATTPSGCTCQPWTAAINTRYTDVMFRDGSRAAAGNGCRNPAGEVDRPWCYIVAGSCAVTATFEYCDNIPVCSFTCRETEAGTEYNGPIGTDAAGNACSSWTRYDATLAFLFTADPAIPTTGVCRNIAPDISNPNFVNLVPWCIVNENLSNCNIPFCSQVNPTGCRTDHLGASYRGNHTTTVTGKTCIRWDAATVYTAATWPVTGETITAAANQCRNPNNSPAGLWCLVNATDWEPCLVPACIPISNCPNTAPEFYRYKDFLTFSSCATWSSVYAARSAAWYNSKVLPPTSLALRSPLFSPALLPDLNLGAARSYCRNPDNDVTGPWCPTAAGTKQYCSNPCSLLPCLTDTQGLYYAGIVNVTRLGVPCQAWATQFPISHSFATNGWFPDGSASRAKNYCRTPDQNRWGPWCYKANYTGIGNSWDYCNIPLCTGITTATPTASTSTDNCLKTTTGTGYAGPMATTSTGKTCLNWVANSANHPYYLPQMFNAASMSDVSNFCRNPDSSITGPWCYVSASTRETCTIQMCSTVNVNTTTTPTTNIADPIVGIAGAIVGGLAVITMGSLLGALMAAAQPSPSGDEPLIQQQQQAGSQSAAPPPPASAYEMLKTTRKITTTTRTTDTTVDEYDDLTTSIVGEQSTPPLPQAPPTVSETVTKTSSFHQSQAAGGGQQASYPAQLRVADGGGGGGGSGGGYAASYHASSGGYATRSGGGGNGGGGSAYIRRGEAAYGGGTSYVSSGGARGTLYVSGGGGGGASYMSSGGGGGGASYMSSGGGGGGASYVSSGGAKGTLYVSSAGRGGGGGASYISRGGGGGASYISRGGGGGGAGYGSQSVSYTASSGGGGGSGGSSSRYAASASTSGGGGRRITRLVTAASSSGQPTSGSIERRNSIVDDSLASYVSAERR